MEKILSSRKLKKHQILKHVENAKTFEKVMLEHVENVIFYLAPCALRCIECKNDFQLQEKEVNMK